jgi:hypothetical protein
MSIWEGGIKKDGILKEDILDHVFDIKGKIHDADEKGNIYRSKGSERMRKGEIHYTNDWALVDQ